LRVERRTGDSTCGSSRHTQSSLTFRSWMPDQTADAAKRD
jgi:hypothetical protein